MSKRRRTIVTGPCSYCGKERSLEPEHVVPQALFFDKSQATVIISACEECNREKAEGDGDLRDYMATSIRGRHHPVARQLLPQIQTAFRKGASRFGKWAQTAPSLPRMTPEGIYLGYSMLQYEELPEMERTLRYIIRGLHFHESNMPVLPTTEVDIKIVPFELYPSIIRDVHQPFLPRPRMLGPDVFSWQPIGLGSDERKSFWILRFYNGVAVIGSVGQCLGIPRPPRPQHRFLIPNGKGRRERALKQIVKRGLVTLPPEDYLSFLAEAQRLAVGTKNPSPSNARVPH